MPPPLIAGAALMLITVSLLAVPTQQTHLVLAAEPEPAGAQLAGEALTLLNDARAAAGLAPLSEGPELGSVAVERAMDMAAAGALSHYGPSGSTAESLLLAHGFTFARLGENIARSNDSIESVVAVVHYALMASERHRANMLDPWFEQVGIGVARFGDTYYFAVVFVTED